MVSLPPRVSMLPSIRPLVVMRSSPAPVRMAASRAADRARVVDHDGPGVQLSSANTPTLSPVIVPLLFNTPPALVK